MLSHLKKAILSDPVEELVSVYDCSLRWGGGGAHKKLQWANKTRSGGVLANNRCCKWLFLSTRVAQVHPIWSVNSVDQSSKKYSQVRGEQAVESVHRDMSSVIDTFYAEISATITLPYVAWTRDSSGQGNVKCNKSTICLLQHTEAVTLYLR